MKKVQFFISTILILLSQSAYSQDVPEGAIMLNESTLIIDESGDTIEMFKMVELMNSGEWFMEPVQDEAGELLYIQLRKATEEEKKMMASMPSPGTVSDKLGKKAPDFKMEDVNGNQISSQKTKGKVVVLNFWFAACKPCIAEIPELNEVYEKYKSNPNIVFASVTFENSEAVDSFLRKHPIKYPVVSDAKEICDVFQVSGYPTNIILDKNGNYFDVISGGFPKIGHHISNSIQKALEAE